MNIPSVTAASAATPARLVQQLREASLDVIAEARASVEVDLRPEARLLSLVDRLLGEDPVGLDARASTRLIGNQPLFSDAFGGSFAALGLAARLPPELAGLEDIGRGGFDAQKLAETLRGTPELLPLVQASLARSGIDALFGNAAANDSQALPASIRLYLDNGGVAGARLDAALAPRAAAQGPLP